MRVFTAFPVSPEARKNIVKLQLRISEYFPGENIHLVPPENIHITLVFLGDIPEDSLESVSFAVRKSVNNECSFGAGIYSAGAFPSIERPRVLWLGLGNVNILLRIKSKLDYELEKIGKFRQDKRKFFPHITIGRVRGSLVRVNAAAFFAHGNEINNETGVIEINSIQIIESRLSPSGAKYRVIEDIKFLNKKF